MLGFLVKSKKEMIKKISFLLNDDTKRKQSLDILENQVLFLCKRYKWLFVP